MRTREPHLYLLIFRPTKPCRIDSDQRIKALLKTAKRIGLQCIKMRLIALDDIDAAPKAGPPEAKMPNGAEKFNVIIESTKWCRAAPIHRVRRALKAFSRHHLRCTSRTMIGPKDGGS